MSLYDIKRTDDEINDQLNLSWEFDSRYSGLTYGEGARAFYDWLVGDSDELPFNPEDLD